MKYLLCIILLCAGVNPAQAAGWVCSGDGPAMASTGRPAPVDKTLWHATYDGQLALAKLKAPRVVFLGDSQTEWWPGDLWQTYFAPLDALNFGIHSDKTENLLWRFEHADAAIWNASVYVVLIGTNNLSLGNSAAQTADGVRVLLSAIATHAPQAKTIVIGLLPRERGTNDWVAKAVAETNSYLKSCAARPNVGYLDLGDLLTDSHGETNDGIGEDKLHLTPAGYGRISPRIAGAIAKILPSKSK